MNRYIVCVAATAVLALVMVALGASPGVTNYDTLQLSAAAIMATGVSVLLVGFVSMTYSATPIEKVLNEHLIIFGLMIAGFGMGIFPFIAEKVFIVPLCAAISFAMMRIAIKMRRDTAIGQRRYSPVFLTAACGFASVWALAAGWELLQASSFMVVGIPAALIHANTGRTQRDLMPVAG
jgi:hypothetical protein